MAPRSAGSPGTPGFQSIDPDDPGYSHEDESYSELERLRTEAGPDSAWSVMVFRKSQDGLRFNYCRRLPLAGFDLDKLPETFGGGAFLLRVRDDRGKIAKTINIAFDPGVWPSTPAAPAAPPAGLNDPTVSGMLIGLQRQLDEDRKGRERFLETLVTAMLTKGQVSTPTMTDLVDAQIKLRDLTTPQQKSDGDLVLQAVRLALEAGGGLRGEGGGGDEDIFSKVIDKVAVPIVEAIRENRKANAARPVALPAASHIQGPAPGAPGGALPPELEPYRFLRQYSQHLLGWARTNFSPDRVSAVIYNLVPDEYFPVLESFLSRSAPERFSILVQLDARLQPYQTYLDAVMTALSQEIALDAEPGEGASGGDSDTPPER